MSDNWNGSTKAPITVSVDTFKWLPGPGAKKRWQNSWVVSDIAGRTKRGHENRHHYFHVFD